MDAPRVTASSVRLSVSKKFLEWEGDPNRVDRSKGTLITDIAKQIITYRNRINNAQRLPEETKVEMVTIMELDELVQLDINITGQGIL